jgi:hypothetical protein
MRAPEEPFGQVRPRGSRGWFANWLDVGHRHRLCSAATARASSVLPLLTCGCAMRYVTCMHVCNLSHPAGRGTASRSGCRSRRETQTQDKVSKPQPHRSIELLTWRRMTFEAAVSAYSKHSECHMQQEAIRASYPTMPSWWCKMLYGHLQRHERWSLTPACLTHAAGSLLCQRAQVLHAPAQHAAK